MKYDVILQFNGTYGKFSFSPCVNELESCIEFSNGRGYVIIIVGVGRGWGGGGLHALVN